MEVQGERGGGDAVVVEELQALVHLHAALQVVLQFLDGHLVDRVPLFGVLAQGSLGGEADTDVVRGVAIVVGAAVRRPHVLGDRSEEHTSELQSR